MDNHPADLHIHSTYSDGLLAPHEIVDRAMALDLKAIAITDHDSVEGIDESLNTAKDKIEVIPAVELSANIGDIDVHVLGYYIDHRQEDLVAFLEDFKEYRLKRVEKILKNLSADGINIDFEKVKLIGGSGSLGRPHIAEALRQGGFVHSINEAFIRFLGYHSRYYEPKKEIEPKEIIKKIKKCKGIAVIAHPGTLGNLELLYQLIVDGIMGIEVWHPEHSKQDETNLYETAVKNGLLITGGSDFHGYPRSHIDIGRYGCSIDHVLRLKESKRV